MPATGHLATRHARNTGIVPITGGVNLPPFARRFNHDCLGYKPLNRTNVHSTSPSYPMCFKGEAQQFKGKAASLAKGTQKVVRDPLFCINHTFAMLRANINRLIRKTWHHQKVQPLIHHLTVYMFVHNHIILKGT